MDGFKNSTRMKYMSDSGGVYNERGKRATMAEIAAEDRRMVDAAPKKAVGPSSSAVSKVLAGMAKKALPAGGIGGAAAGAAGSALGKIGAQAAEAALLRRATGAAVTEGERRAILAAAKKAVPSYSDRPVIRRNKGGLTAMPKGKC
jgi:hypothetical protein